MSSLYRLVYTSYRKNACDQDEVKIIINKSLRFNGERKISGILIYSDYRFFQYLEGTESDISELFEKIKRDDCHTSVNQRLYSQIPSRLFPDWTMAALDLDGDELTFEQKSTNNTSNKIRELILGDSFIRDEGIKIMRKFENDLLCQKLWLFENQKYTYFECIY